jgi:hypothetical protein
MGSAAQGFQLAGSQSSPSQGAQLAGSQASPAQGGQLSGTFRQPPETSGVTPRAVTLTGANPSSGVPGTQLGAPSIDASGGTFGIPDASVDDLIDTEGFAVVLENPSRSERLAFSPDEPAYRGIKSVSWVSEVNATASWEATIPANDDIYRWNYSDVTVAYNGERRFHGVMLPVSASEFADGEVTIAGYGPLYWGRSGNLTLSYAETPAWRALEDVWAHVARETNGRVRGTVVRPRPDHASAHHIPTEGVEWSGTPAEVLDKAHATAGMAWGMDHTDPAAIATSFVPGEELRRVDWTAKQGGITPEIDPEGYRNQITVVGDRNPATGERYSATVSAPQPEIDQVADGLILSDTERDPELTSTDACRLRARTLLDSARGEFTVGGSLDINPGARRLVPGYTYRVEEFDRAAPGIFTPVWATLQQVSHSYGVGEASVSLDFSDESGLVAAVIDELKPPNQPSAARRDSQLDLADANYDAPMGYAYEFGAGRWGGGTFGATADIDDTQQS